MIIDNLSSSLLERSQQIKNIFQKYLEKYNEYGIPVESISKIDSYMANSIYDINNLFLFSKNIPIIIVHKICEFYFKSALVNFKYVDYKTDFTELIKLILIEITGSEYSELVIHFNNNNRFRKAFINIFKNENGFILSDNFNDKSILYNVIILYNVFYELVNKKDITIQKLLNILNDDKEFNEITKEIKNFEYIFNSMYWFEWADPCNQ
jgi:hypothetical protein